MDLSRKFVRNILNRMSDIGEVQIQSAKECYLDYLGVLFYGISDSRSADLKQTFSCDNELTYAFRLGVFSHILELDDGDRRAMMHPGSPIISSLIAFVRNKDVSYDEFLKAIIIGYEVSLSLSESMQPQIKKNGYHASGLFGVVGSAFACGYLSGFCEDDYYNLLSASLGLSAGMLKMIDDDSNYKSMNIGNAALNGILAKNFVSSKFTGPIDVLNSKRGFSQVYDVKINENILLKFEGSFRIENIYRKYYSACRHCHSPIEAAINISNKIDNYRDYDITVETYSLAINGHNHNEINSSYSGKMSIQYCVAVSLLYGRCSDDLFEKRVYEDEDVKYLTKKINVVEDKNLSILVPTKRAARITLSKEYDDKFIELIEYPLGEPENPIKGKMLEEKFRDLCLKARIENNMIEKYIIMIKSSEFDFELLNETINMIGEKL